MEPRTDVLSPEVRRPTWPFSAARSPGRTTLCVGDVMSKEVVTAAAEDTMVSVAQKMSAHSISCVVITDPGHVVGILTEKDMLNAVARGTADLSQLRVSEWMSHPVDTVPAHVSIFEADQMMERRCIRRLPVVENERLAGLVTQTDITRALLSLNSLGCVADIMTQHVATVPSDATAKEAARQMACSDLSCLAVTREEKIVGILTEKDLFKRIVALQKDPTQTRVLDVMSLPVVTIASRCSILDASKKMETMHFHRLLVTEGAAICGIVTQTDIMRAVRQSSEAAESQQRLLKEELTDVLQRAIRDMQRVRDFLGDIPHPLTEADPAACLAPPPLEQMISGAASLAEES